MRSGQCRFVNDALHIRESEKNLFRRTPVKRSHRKIIVLTLANSKLFSEIIKGIELMRSIKIFVIFSVTAFYLTVMPWRSRIPAGAAVRCISDGAFQEAHAGCIIVLRDECKMVTSTYQRIW